MKDIKLLMNSPNLSRNEFKIYLEAKRAGKKVLAVNDVLTMLNESRIQAYHQLHKMNKKGLIKRLKKGLYYIYPDHLLFNACNYVEDPIYVLKKLTDPYFISHQTALDLYGLSQRSLNTLYFTTIKHVKPFIQTAYKIQPIIVFQKYFFGHIKMAFGNEVISVSDMERTVLDIINRPELAHGFEDVIESILEIDKDLNYSKLLDYLFRFNKKILFQRVGYLFDTPAFRQRLKVPNEFLNTLESINYSVNYLDPSRKKGIFNKKWKLIVPRQIQPVFDFY